MVPGGVPCRLADGFVAFRNEASKLGIKREWLEWRAAGFRLRSGLQGGGRAVATYPRDSTKGKLAVAVRNRGPSTRVTDGASATTTTTARSHCPGLLELCPIVIGVSTRGFQSKRVLADLPCPRAPAACQ
jgi:hypothetical protein